MNLKRIFRFSGTPVADNTITNKGLSLVERAASQSASVANATIVSTSNANVGLQNVQVRIAFDKCRFEGNNRLVFIPLVIFRYQYPEWQFLLRYL